jgi:acetyl esterase/lipase
MAKCSRRRSGLAAVTAGLGLALLAGPAPAQNAPPEFHFTPTARPAEAPQEFPLYPGAAPGSESARQVESWARMSVGAADPGGAVVRNVTRPTYSVFRPAQGKATGAAVILAPGGAFLSLAMETEGWMAARWLADHGVTAFVLKYRLNETAPDTQAFMAQVGATMAKVAQPGNRPPDIAHEKATADGEAMVRLVRARAAEFGVDPRRIGFVGFSAGAMTALSVALADAPGAEPDFVGLIYPPMTPVAPPPDAPPAFVALARNDSLFGRSGFGLVESWHAAGKPVELHFYDGGDHGFGMRRLGTTSDHWIDEFYWWMQARGLLKS